MIPLEQAKVLTASFQNKYSSTKELDFLVVKKPEDVYNNAQVKEQGISQAKGAYHPSKQLIVLFSDNAKNTSDFMETIKHEVFGHHALNTLTSVQKPKLLESIEKSQNEKSLKKVWDDVDKTYPNLSKSEKAEEVFAFIAQKTKDSPMIVPLELRGSFSFSGQPITKTYLSVLAKVFSKEMEAGIRLQKIFPETDQSQYSNSKKTPLKAAEKLSQRFTKKGDKERFIQAVQEQLGQNKTPETDRKTIKEKEPER